MRGTAVQRYEAIPHLSIPHMRAAAPARAQAAAQVPVGPYALRYPQTTARRVAQSTLARGWVWGHVMLSFLAVIAAVTLAIASPATRLLGLASLSFAVAGIVLSALALQALSAERAGLAALWLLVADLIGVSLGLAVLGPQFGVVALLPGAVLVTALLAGQVLGFLGVIGGFLLYGTEIALTQAGMLHPLVAPSDAALVWINFGLVFVGTVLLAFAAHWLLLQLHATQAHEAAIAYRMSALERRMRTKRITLDADAMALQTQIAQAMQNFKPQSIATGEELAPLAQMINAANARIPSLLHDRDERLKLERAVRDLIQVLETAWAGFTLTWPAPSHTIVDRLIPLLRPNSTQATTTLKSTH